MERDGFDIRLDLEHLILRGLEGVKDTGGFLNGGIVVYFVHRLKRRLILGTVIVFHPLDRLVIGKELGAEIVPHFKNSDRAVIIELCELFLCVCGRHARAVHKIVIADLREALQPGAVVGVCCTGQEVLHHQGCLAVRLRKDCEDVRVFFLCRKGIAHLLVDLI